MNNSDYKVTLQPEKISSKRRKEGIKIKAMKKEEERRKDRILYRDKKYNQIKKKSSELLKVSTGYCVYLIKFSQILLENNHMPVVAETREDLTSLSTFSSGCTVPVSTAQPP